MKERKILVTGFEPWGKWERNPSVEIAEALAGREIGGYSVLSTPVPVVHGEDIARVAPLIDTHRPAAVVSLGLGGGATLRVERVAVNLKVLSDGETPQDLQVAEGGPAAYFSTLPVRGMVSALRQDGVPAQLSHSAGTFLCNHLMYSVLHHIAREGLDMPAGFVHIPLMPEQVADTGQPSMTLETMERGIVAALGAVVGKVA
ncbi:MAG: pyroglutamyl-peptidase I [Candidatus Latescibacteria bacterium]|nr:pyroglutamyl-peptidase I [Candidatus Latescibacterota bacterium]